MWKRSICCIIDVTPSNFHNLHGGNVGSEPDEGTAHFALWIVAGEVAPNERIKTQI